MMTDRKSLLPSAFIKWQAEKNAGQSEEKKPTVQTLLSDSSFVPKVEPKPTCTLTDDNVKRFPMNGVQVEFPFQPYPSQIQMMAKIIQALKKKQNALLESPTGSGKSLAILCAALAWQGHERKLLQEEINRRAKEAKEQHDLTWREIAYQNELHEAAVANMLIKPETVKLEKDNPPSSMKRTGVVKEESVDDDDDDFRPIAIPKRMRRVEPMKPDPDQPTTDENMIPLPKSSSYQPVPKIYVGSRTHRQLSQLVRELRSNTRYRPKMSVLGSRDQYCIHPKVSKATDKTSECVAMLDLNSCTYATRVNKVVSKIHTASEDAIWDIEDLNALGKRVHGCPYYASRTLAETADIIFCPYNYLLDPIVRKSMDINTRGSIIILDEAHNIEDVARSAGSFETTESELHIIQIELTQVIRGGWIPEMHEVLLYFVDSLMNWISNPQKADVQRTNYEEQLHLWSGEQLLEQLQSLAITKHTFNSTLIPAFNAVQEHAEKMRKERDDVIAVESAKAKASGQADPSGTENKKTRVSLSTPSLRILEGLFMVFGFLFEDGRNYAEDYRMALIKKISRAPNFSKSSSWVYKLGFWCLNPGVIFRKISEEAHSVVLTSGTLSPLNTFASELEADFPIRLEASHVIDSSQVWVNSINYGPGRVDLCGTWDKVSKFAYQDAVGEALCRILETVPYGILCFVPSYSTMDKLIDRWKRTGTFSKMEALKHIICEPQGSNNKQSFDKELKKYYDHIKAAEPTGTDAAGKHGALFFAVYRGKVSEGIDFTDNNCRAVVALGIPYPNIKDVQVEMKREYNDRRKRGGGNVLSGSEWYNTQAYRAINQALGRCIRHRKDWGAVILLEARFQNQSNVSQLSKWIRPLCQFQDDFRDAMQGLEVFTQRRVAIDRLAYEEALQALNEDYHMHEPVQIYQPHLLEPSSHSPLHITSASNSSSDSTTDAAKKIKIENEDSCT